jgi:hypothetical protein
MSQYQYISRVTPSGNISIIPIPQSWIYEVDGLFRSSQLRKTNDLFLTVRRGSSAAVQKREKVEVSTAAICVERLTPTRCRSVLLTVRGEEAEEEISAISNVLKSLK